MKKLVCEWVGFYFEVGQLHSSLTKIPPLELVILIGILHEAFETLHDLSDLSVAQEKFLFEGFCYS